MKCTLLKPLLFTVFLFLAFLVKAQTVTLEMLDGPNGYFKTYDDFLCNRAVPFNKPQFGKHNDLKTITFYSNNSKITFWPIEIWGYRFNHLLFRTETAVEFGVLIVVSVGDMILYETYHSPHLYISDDGNKASFMSANLNIYVSKDLNSKIEYELNQLKPEPSEPKSDIYDCGENIVGCYLTYNSIAYVCKFPGYKKINHRVLVKHIEIRKPH